MSGRYPPLPGVPVGVPLPPQLVETFGYPGRARCVSFYWIPIGDQVVYDDDRSVGTGSSQVVPDLLPPGTRRPELRRGHPQAARFDLLNPAFAVATGTTS